MKEYYFYPTAFKGYVVIVFTHGTQMGGQAFGQSGGRTLFGWWEKACPGCVSENLRCMMVIIGRDIGSGCQCATS